MQQAAAEIRVTKCTYSGFVLELYLYQISLITHVGTRKPRNEAKIYFVFCEGDERTGKNTNKYRAKLTTSNSDK